MSDAIHIEESEVSIHPPRQTMINDPLKGALFVTMASSVKTDAIKEGEAVAFRGRFCEVHLKETHPTADQSNVTLTLLDICSVASPETLKAWRTKVEKKKGGKK